jgi:hypothetical protein
MFAEEVLLGFCSVYQLLPGTAIAVPLGRVCISCPILTRAVRSRSVSVIASELPAIKV